MKPHIIVADSMWECIVSDQNAQAGPTFDLEVRTERILASHTQFDLESTYTLKEYRYER